MITAEPEVRVRLAKKRTMDGWERRYIMNRKEPQGRLDKRGGRNDA
ncbi:hypothetical protein [Porcincola intestinalis]|jgi:hypothetical protein|nr:hypothetical protein [Porcincola intestinalis]